MDILNELCQDDGTSDDKLRDLGIGSPLAMCVGQETIQLLLIPAEDLPERGGVDNEIIPKTRAQAMKFYQTKSDELLSQEPSTSAELNTYIDALVGIVAGGVTLAQVFVRLISMWTDPEAPVYIFKKKQYLGLLGTAMYNEHDDEYYDRYPAIFTEEFEETCRQSFIESMLMSSEFILSYNIEDDIAVGQKWTIPKFEVLTR